MSAWVTTSPDGIIFLLALWTYSSKASDFCLCLAGLNLSGYTDYSEALFY